MDDERPSVPTDEPLDGFIGIDEVVHWMASLGNHLSNAETVVRLDNAERSVVAALRDGRISSEGHDENSIYAPIPPITWAGVGGMEHVSDFNRPIFYIGLEGGVLSIGRRSVRGIRVRKIDVLRVWSEELRDDLIEHCRQGRVNPREAQDWAIDLTRRLLPGEPDAEAFDPLRKCNWSLGMSLAWIMTGSADAVREMCEEWRESNEMWAQDSRVVSGEAPPGVRRLGSMSRLAELEADAAKSGTLVKPRKDSRDELWKALEGGRLVATGLPIEGGIRKEVSAFRWQDLNLFEERWGILVTDDAAARTGFRNVAIPSKQIRTLWPLRSKSRRTRDDQEKACEDWLAEMMRDSPDSRPKTKAEIRRDAESKFPGIFDEAFNRAWSKALKSTGAVAWSRPGAPRKIPDKKSPTRQ